MIDKGKYDQAATKLEDDVLSKMDGHYGGDPLDDWIVTLEGQQAIYPLVQSLIDDLRGMPKKDVEQNQEDESVPENFHFSEAYPNPFNPSTEMHYKLPKEERVFLRIYNLLGQPVRTLVDEIQQTGDYKVRWDATDDSGNPVSSGIYICRFRAGSNIVTRKLMFME